MHSPTAAAGTATVAAAPALWLMAPLEFTFVSEEVGADTRYECVPIREGVYQPGIGNPDGKRIFIPRSLIQRIAPTMGGKPVNMEHSKAMNDEVGVMENPHMDADDVRMRAVACLQRSRPRYMDALGFIKGRLDAGLVPNVSVEFGKPVISPGAGVYEGQAYDATLADATFEGMAILSKGACDDSAGCGIGMGILGLANIIGPPSAPKFSDAKWSKPTLADFGGDLGKARTHFLVERNSPPKTYDDLVFPYREVASGDVNVHALRAIAGERGSSASLPGDVKKRAQDIARRLLDDHNKDASPKLAAPCIKGDGCLTVLALQGIDNHKERTNMDEPNGSLGLCAKDAAALQAAHKALEADLNKTKLALASRDSEVLALTKKVEGYEAAERLALTEALTRTLPAGTDIKTVVGENPTTEALMLAYKTAQALKPEGELALGAGRRTANPARDAADKNTQKAHELHLTAMRAQYGIKTGKESKLPASMQRNTDLLLAKEAPASAQ